MRRATALTLRMIEPWLDEVRALGIDGLVEKANGAFYERRKAILHFHEDEHGAYADVKVDGDWRRVHLDDARRAEVVVLLRAEYLSSAPAPPGG